MSYPPPPPVTVGPQDFSPPTDPSASLEPVVCKEEISYLQKLRHPRLVSFLGFARDAGQVADSKPRRNFAGMDYFFFLFF